MNYHDYVDKYGLYYSGDGIETPYFVSAFKVSFGYLTNPTPGTVFTELHRWDGPASIMENGDKIWYIHGKPIAYFSHEHNRWIGADDTLETWLKDNKIDLENLTPEDQTIMKLFWS